MDYIQFTFDDISPDKKDMLVAMLGDIGFEGFEEEKQTLKAFVESDLFDASAFDSVIDILNVNYSRSDVKKINWNEKWESDFHPVEVIDADSSKPLVYIRASFHQPNPGFEYDIVVTPKMSFGTGHHATTFLMVLHMQHLDFKNKRVIDFGTGTGVLAIFAEKLGAKMVVGIDCDDWSIENAKENVEANGCSKIKIEKAETITPDHKAEIILANINLNIIAANISQITHACFAGTKILFSGIMIHDEVKISAIIANAGLIIEQVYKRENWIAVLAVNP